MSIRVLACGGRDYQDEAAVFVALERLHEERGIDLLIHGACKDRKTGRLSGADRHAQVWAFRRDVPYLGHPARWTEHENAAGPIRNADMLRRWKPHVVVGFPTPGALNKGTNGMMKLARDAGVEVIEIAP